MKQKTNNQPATPSPSNTEQVEGFKRVRATHWGETIHIASDDMAVCFINPNGNSNAGIPSEEDRLIAARIVETWNNYDGLKQELEKIKKELAGMYALNKEGWSVAENYEKQSDRLKADNKVLLEALKHVMEDLRNISCRYAGYTIDVERKDYYGNIASYKQAEAALNQQTNNQ